MTRLARTTRKRIAALTATSVVLVAVVGGYAASEFVDRSARDDVLPTTGAGRGDSREIIESAPERLERLLGGRPSKWTSMTAPGEPPPIEPMLLVAARHDGHAGLYADRPDGYRPVAIVLHATGSGRPGTAFDSLESLNAFFQRRGVAASHYAIDRTGRIAQYVDDRSAAFHVARPGWNSISIGIELLNDNTGAQPFPTAQVAAARELVLHLGGRYRIPVEAVVRHRDIQPEDRTDPAANFDWDRFIESLRAPTVASRGRTGAGRSRIQID